MLGIPGIAVGAWYIWWQRREVVKGERVASTPSTVFSIQALDANFASSPRTPRSVNSSLMEFHAMLSVDV